MTNRKAIGVTCGIGSMLVGAKQAGFEIAGNVEWRKYYHQGATFQNNFPGALFLKSLDHMTTDEIEKFMGADLALGHPECGNFSTLNNANRNPEQDLLDPADIPLFVDLIAKLKPRFFVMDDLPKSFMAFPMSEYSKRLPEYDLFPEWVSNWGYGNVQKNRKRMFMIGSLKQEKFVFVPGEAEHDLTVRDVIEDLGEPRVGSNYPNHDPHDDSVDCFRALNLGGYGKKSTWAETAEYFKQLPTGSTLKYLRKDGSTVARIGFLKGHWEGPAHVLTGGNATVHPIRCNPYTIRERARIQGFPDDFVFYGTVLNDRGEWCHDFNQHMIRQTGKAMPVQFCQYASQQVMAHVRGELWSATGRRLLPNNEHVDEAKKWFCQNVGYADQEEACSACWLAARCAIRVDRYGYPAIGRPTSVAPQRAVATEQSVLTDSDPRSDQTTADIEQLEPIGIKVTERRARRSKEGGVTVASRPTIETKIVSFG